LGKNRYGGQVKRVFYKVVGLTNRENGRVHSLAIFVIDKSTSKTYYCEQGGFNYDYRETSEPPFRSRRNNVKLH
jgi:hypothetical protein